MLKFIKTEVHSSPLKKHIIIEQLQLQNPHFHFFANLPRMPEDIKKYKNKN